MLFLKYLLILTASMTFMMSFDAAASDYYSSGYKNNEKIVPYVDLGFGIGIHSLPDTDEGTSSRILKTSVGVQWLSFLSAQVGLLHWSNYRNGGRNNNPESDDKEEGQPLEFDGISVAWELTAQLPIGNKIRQLSHGPYYRFGRHCWTAVLSGLSQPWSKEGCSNIQSIGFVFPTSSSMNSELVWFLELSQTDLERLESRSVQISAKLPF